MSVNNERNDKMRKCGAVKDFPGLDVWRCDKPRGRKGDHEDQKYAKEFNHNTSWKRNEKNDKMKLQFQWIDYHPHQNASPCFSCAKQCKTYKKLMKDPKSTDMKNEKIKIISKCGQYKEQIFTL